MESNWKDKTDYVFGDIVVAKRKWEDLQKGHTHSPHIVIANDGNFIYAITGSTCKPNIDSSRKRIHVKLRNVDAYYEPLIYKFKYKDVHYKIGTVSTTTMDYVKRKLDSQIVASINMDNDIYKEIVPKTDFNTGDIIMCNNENGLSRKYVIISQNEESYQVLEIAKNEDLNNSDEYYSIRYDIVRQIDKTSNIYRIDALDLKETENLLTKVKTSNIRKQDDTLVPGQIVRINNKDYYVIDVTNSKAALHPVSKEIYYDSFFIHNGSRVRINFSMKLMQDISTFDGEVLSVVPYKTHLSIKRKYDEYQNNKSIKIKSNSKSLIYKVPHHKSNQYLLLDKVKTQIIILDLTKYYNGEIEISRQHQRFLVRNPSGNLGISDYNNIMSDISEIMKKEYNVELPRYANVRTKNINGKDKKKK